MIGSEGEQIGILPVNEALDRAKESGYDLVEVSPNSRPPVCRILDYGKYKYELSKKDRIAKKKQHAFQLKEMRFRPKIDDHDYRFKTKHVREFVESGSKVKVFVMFRGRERAHTEYGKVILDRVAEDLADIALVEMQAKMEGRTMNMVLGPTAEVMKKIKDRQKKSSTEAAAPVAEEATTGEAKEVETAAATESKQGD